MIYLFYGIEDYLIQKEIDSIKQKNNIEEISISRYDLINTNIDKIIEDCEMNSMFTDKKVIIVNNSYIFTGQSKKGQIEQNLEALEKYINNSNIDTLLIFISDSEKLDERKKIVKLIKQKGIVKEFNTTTNINSIVKSFFNDYKISDSSITKLINRVGNNLPLLEEEAEKLKLYKDDIKEINDEDILKITNKNVDLDIFKLIDNIIMKNKKVATETYNEMIKYGEEPIKILIMIASQIRLMYQTKLLYKKGYTEKDSASLLGIHPYRVKLATEKGRKYTESDLLMYLDNLADLDSKIKQSNVDKKMAIELFILKI